MSTRTSLRLLAALLSLSCLSSAQALHKPLPLPSPLQDKNFYLLSLLDKDPAVRKDLASDKALSAIAAERQTILTVDQRFCKGDAACALKGFLWTDEEIDATSLALASLYQHSAPLKHLVDVSLRQSGAYEIYGTQSGADLLAGAWRVCASGMNHILSVYGEGEPPRYPVIDSPSVDPKSAEFQKQEEALLSDSTPASFFAPSLKAALALLQLNHRDEAARLEPMEDGENRAAIAHIATMHWDKFPYSVIVVPGAGPSDRETALSIPGRKRTQLAADAYHAGQAPFVLVSGGYVHPSQTRFAEALEMKKALIHDFNVPETAILIDPHARHTTTNLRNAVREIYRYNMPMQKPALVISDAAQIGYIANPQFGDRCMKELGYLPYRILSQPNESTLVFMPQSESLEQDPIDPLDP